MLFLTGYKPQPLLNLEKNLCCAHLNIARIFAIAAIVNNVIPSFVPKLDVSGTNWAVFLLYFKIAI